MSATRVQLLVAGSKIVAFTIPMSPPLCPPATNSRPSDSTTCAAQNICDDGLGMLVKVWLIGSKSLADWVPPVSQASHIMRFPFGSSPMCTSTSGQFITGDHSPVAAAPAAAVAVGLDVAVTVAVAVTVEVAVRVGVAVGTAGGPAVGLSVAGGLDVAVGLDVTVAVGLGVAVGPGGASRDAEADSGAVL